MYNDMRGLSSKAHIDKACLHKHLQGEIICTGKCTARTTSVGMLAQQLALWPSPAAALQSPFPGTAGPSAALPAASAGACCASLPASPPPLLWSTPYICPNIRLILVKITLDNSVDTSLVMSACSSSCGLHH